MRDKNTRPERTRDRGPDDLRPVRIFPDYLEFADGSALIEMGRTKVVAAATVEDKVPPFLKGMGQGWVTAEYSMLPRATEKRTVRERQQGYPSGRSQEIQRLIGRVLRAVTDMRVLGERQIILDCDVIQADGGTRVAAINAACVALALALKKLYDAGVIDSMPLHHLVGAVSVGIIGGEPRLDLDYVEDSGAETDMNVVETDRGQLLEVQATAERTPFSRNLLESLLRLADKGIAEIIQVQKDVLKRKSLLFMAYARQ
jgi:ribonuclease PH